jgi:hypothetical protein
MFEMYKDGTLTKNQQALINKISAKLGKKVVNLNTNETFNSIREASRKYNISSGNICSCCKGDFKTAGGYAWSYL